MDVLTLQTDCALMLHDAGLAEITSAQWVSFIRSASLDARNEGWYIYMEDDESLAVAMNTYEYNVPSTFCSVDKLLIEETISGIPVYVTEIPRPHYELRLNGGVPVFTFNTITQLVYGKHIKVVGQKRPTIYSSTADAVDAGMESFLRERALYFGFRYTGAGMSELAAWRRQMAVQAWQTSEAFLHRHPASFRQSPSGQIVPGRE